MSDTRLTICMFDNERVRGGAEEHMLCLLHGLDRRRFKSGEGIGVAFNFNCVELVGEKQEVGSSPITQKEHFIPDRIFRFSKSRPPAQNSLPTDGSLLISASLLQIALWGAECTALVSRFLYALCMGRPASAGASPPPPPRLKTCLQCQHVRSGSLDGTCVRRTCRQAERLLCKRNGQNRHNRFARKTLPHQR